MTSCAATRAIYEHRAHRRLERIAHGEFLESVTADQFLAGVLREFALRARTHPAGGDQRLFDVMPASRARMRARTFLRAARGRAQPCIDGWINVRHRIIDLTRSVLCDDHG